MACTENWAGFGSTSFNQSFNQHTALVTVFLTTACSEGDALRLLSGKITVKILWCPQQTTIHPFSSPSSVPITVTITIQFSGWVGPFVDLYVWVHFIWSVLLQFLWLQTKAILEHMAIDSIFKNTVISPTFGRNILAYHSLHELSHPYNNRLCRSRRLICN